MPTISEGVLDPRLRARQGIPGMLAFTDPTLRRGFGLNSQGQVAQVGTITVDTATNSATYTWTINGVVQTYTADSSTDATEVGAGIAAVINAEPLVRGQVIATAAVGVVTLTAKTPGLAFTASDADAKLTTVEAATAAAAASAVGFGLAMIVTGYNGGNPGNTSPGEEEPLVCVPTTSVLTAQVQTTAITYVSTAVINVKVYEVRGGERLLVASAMTTSATDRDTTIDALVTALNAAMPANTVDWAADNATGTAIVGTAEIKGYEFDTEVNHSAVSTEPTFTKTNTTGPSIATSLNRAFVGISEYSQADEAALLTSSSGQWGANAGVRYLSRGVIYVTNSESTGPSRGGDVYVELAPGSTAGQLYAASSATRVALSRRRAVWERDGLVAGDSIASVRLEA